MKANKYSGYSMSVATWLDANRFETTPLNIKRYRYNDPTQTLVDNWSHFEDDTMSSNIDGNCAIFKPLRDTTDRFYLKARSCTSRFSFFCVIDGVERVTTTVCRDVLSLKNLTLPILWTAY